MKSMKEKLYEYFCRIFRREIIRDGFRGVLDRDPEEEALKAYGDSFLGLGMEGLVRDLVVSKEHWERQKNENAEELILEITSGFFDKKTEERLIKKLAEQYSSENNSSLAKALRHLMESELGWEQLITDHRKKITIELFRGILGREPDESESRETQTLLLGQKSLQDALAATAGSAEHWQKQKDNHSSELIVEAFRGILGRDPDEEAQSAYKATMSSLGLAGLLKDLAISKEHWEKQKASHAEELIRDAYQGVLGREPEEEVLSMYEDSLFAIGLEGLIKNLKNSDEFWEKTQIVNSERIVTDLYRGIFDRMPDQEGLHVHQSAIEKNKSIIPTLNRLVKSEELRERLKCYFNSDNNQLIEGIVKALDVDELIRTNSKEISDALASSSTIAEAVDKIKQKECYLRAKKIATLIPEDLEERLQEKMVFLHIDKTAGTTIHEEFKKRYGHDKVLLKHEDPLYRYSPKDLDTFQVIGGHFNYDSIRYSRLNHSKIITFFREPLQRFESLYNFWRSHDKSHPNYVIFHELADTLSLEELCQHQEIQESRLTWNHMTWAVMGQTLWNRWRLKLQKINTPEEKWHYLANKVKPKMKKRLLSFYFIGEQETFDHSMNNLFQLLGQPTNKSYERHNDTIINLKIKDGFKKDFQKIAFSNENKVKISTSLLELDYLMYSEFQNMNMSERWNLKPTV